LVIGSILLLAYRQYERCPASPYSPTLLSYKGAVDLEAKLSEWETFYNFNRPPGAFKGKAPYEELRERL
jgi:hypothetical protein